MQEDVGRVRETVDGEVTEVEVREEAVRRSGVRTSFVSEIYINGPFEQGCGPGRASGRPGSGWVSWEREPVSRVGSQRLHQDE
jgi:hypothetical protein